MRVEDRTELCINCKLEVPWGTCDHRGLCFECAQPRLVISKEKIKWTKMDWGLLAACLVVTAIAAVMLIQTAR